MGFIGWVDRDACLYWSASFGVGEGAWWDCHSGRLREGSGCGWKWDVCDPVSGNVVHIFIISVRISSIRASVVEHKDRYGWYCQGHHHKGLFRDVGDPANTWQCRCSRVCVDSEGVRSTLVKSSILLFRAYGDFQWT